MKSQNKNVPSGRTIRILPYVILAIYVLAVLILFLAELHQFKLDEYFRATDQVLILLALLILPFIVFGMSTFIRSLRMKISGQELEIVLDDFKNDVGNNIINMEANLKGSLSNSEQVFWPFLAGYNVKQTERLEQNKIIIGAKEDISQIFFANLLSRAIDKLTHGRIICQLRVPNGGSMKNFADVRFGWIDIYVDFTGTCCQYFNIDHRSENDANCIKNNEEIVKELNEYGISLGLRWLKPLGASEDYCLVMKKENAEQHGIEEIEDLIEYGRNLVFSADPEFLNRDDCYLGMKRYGINFKSIIPCEVTNRYEFMESSEADVFVGYEKTLDRIEGLGDALEKLDGIMDTKDLIQAVNLLSTYSFFSDNDPRNPVNKFISKL